MADVVVQISGLIFLRESRSFISTVFTAEPAITRCGGRPWLDPTLTTPGSFRTVSSGTKSQEDKERNGEGFREGHCAVQRSPICVFEL